MKTWDNAILVYVANPTRIEDGVVIVGGFPWAIVTFAPPTIVSQFVA